jgi:hypothetical protein
VLCIILVLEAISKAVYMKFLALLFLLLSFCSACSKKYEPDLPGKNNEFHALLVFFGDSSQRIDVTGIKAAMGCSVGTTFVFGQREDDALIQLSLYFPVFRCLSSPGTFTTELHCQYRTNRYTGDIYVNDPASPGSITFTTLTSEFMEGYFETVCYSSATDSVIITGTFKGVPD